MIKYRRWLFRIRIVRYGLVGGIGIPINLAALAVFLHLLGDPMYPLASACAFEVSTTVNFVLNQLFTYGDQQRPRGWQWIGRAMKAQMTSLSALLVTFVIALLLKYGAHVSPYLANALGIIGAFFYNFIISKRFVFRPAAPQGAEYSAEPANIHSADIPGNISLTDYDRRRIQDMQQFEITASTIAPVSSIPAIVSADVLLSIVVPVMNEQQSVRLLYEKLSTKFYQLGKRFEVIFVDDGSTDKTYRELQKLHAEHPYTVHVMRFRKNFGKTPALVAGFSRCRGDVIFTMDGDLQDDPEEIPNFLAKLDEGYDVVTGWKFPRLDPLNKTFPSRIFNGLVSKLTGLYLHDINNGFKAYRREVIDDNYFKLYGEFHRLIPVIAHWRGFRVAEIKVRHYPRAYGISKFGTKRFAQGLIDLLTVLFLTSSLHMPLRLFGKLGVWTFLLGNLVDVFVVVRSFFTGEPIHNQPLLFVGILFIIFGFQFILIGLLAEMIRHYAFQPGEEYSIRQELALHADAYAYTNPIVAPTDAGRQSMPAQTWEVQKHYPPRRTIPRRQTMIPM